MMARQYVVDIQLRCDTCNFDGARESVTSTTVERLLAQHRGHEVTAAFTNYRHRKPRKRYDNVRVFV